MTFLSELEKLIEKYEEDKRANTTARILAEYIQECMFALTIVIFNRNKEKK